MLVQLDGSNHLPLYEHPSDYLSNMSALTRKEARKQWIESIKKVWDNRCAYCGQPPIDDLSLTIDHIRPKSKGGSDRTSNIIPACLKCNHSKGSEDWLQWFVRQTFYCKSREDIIHHWLSPDNIYLQHCDQHNNQTN